MFYFFEEVRGGNVPTPDRNLTALLLNIKRRHKILVDCGEDFQVSNRK